MCIRDSACWIVTWHSLITDRNKTWVSGSADGKATSWCCLKVHARQPDPSGCTTWPTPPATTNNDAILLCLYKSLIYTLKNKTQQHFSLFLKNNNKETNKKLPPPTQPPFFFMSTGSHWWKLYNFSLCLDLSPPSDWQWALASKRLYTDTPQSLDKSVGCPNTIIM